METVFHLPGQPAGEMSGKNKMRKKRRGQTGAIKVPLLHADCFMKTSVQTLSLHTFVLDIAFIAVKDKS